MKSTTEAKPFLKRHVKELREAYGLNQTEFADRIGVSQGAVARWECADDGREPKGPVAILLRQMAVRKKIKLR
jgi:DNA-binding transcriptional regulator YiaG